MNKQKSSGFTLWLTGLPSSGKSTLAREVVANLEQQIIPCELLDGDVIRNNLSKDLGFSKQDRDTNVLRVGYICNLLNKHGINTIVALVSPYRDTREKLRLSLPNFIEVHVDCPLEICIARDPKGLYRKALAGEIPHFTGISSPYEPPINSELRLSTDKETVEHSVQRILEYIRNKNFS